MITTQWTQWLASWKWAPLIVLLTLQVRLSDTISLAVHYLIIPIGAHLARRYGRSGFVVLVVSGLPLLFGWSFDAWYIPSGPDVYLAALLISWWLHTRPAIPIDFPRLRFGRWVVIGCVILPLRIGLGSYDLPWLDDGDLLVTGYAFFFLLLFMLGHSRVALQPVLITLSLAAVFGLILEYFPFPANGAQWLQANRAELPLFGLTDLRSFHISYRFDSPAELLTACGFVFWGRFLADQYACPFLSRPSPTIRSILIPCLFLLAFGGQVNAYFLAGDNPALHWLGSFYAIILVAMFAGFHLRFAGILSLLFLVTGFWWIDAILRADFDLSTPRFYFTMGHLLYIYGFGLLGIGIRDTLEHTSTRLWSGAWFRFLLVYFLLIINLIPIETPYDILLITLVFLSGITCILLVNRLRDQFSTTEISLKGGWLSSASIIMMGYLVYRFGKDAWPGVHDIYLQTIGMVKQLILARKALDGEELVLFGVVAGAVLCGLWTITSTLTGLLKSTQQLSRDLRALYERMRNKFPLTLTIRGRNTASATRHSDRISTGLLRIITWSNRALLTALLLFFSFIIGYNGWLQYQDQLAFAWRAPTSPAPLSPEDLQKRKEREKARADLVANLTDSCREALQEYPDIHIEHRKYGTAITTGWYSNPSEPQTRRRVSIAIRPAIGSRERSPDDTLRRSIEVYVYHQDKGRFNLWVEHLPNPHWQQEQELRKELKQTIMAISRDKQQMNH